MSFEKPDSLLAYAKKVGIKDTVDEIDKLVKQVLPIAEAEKAEREQTPLFFSGEVFNSTFQPRQAGGASSWTSDKQFASDYPYVAFHAAAITFLGNQERLEGSLMKKGYWSWLQDCN